MGMFDGLIANVEGAVTSAEVMAAGLVTGPAKPAAAAPAASPISSFLTGALTMGLFSPASTAPARPALPSSPFTNPFVGPLQPPQARAPGFTAVAPSATPAPATPSSSFNMVADMMANIPGVSSIPGVSAIENFFGLTPSAPAAPAAVAGNISTWGTDLTRWENILSSLDKSMNQRDGHSDLSAQVSTWKNGPYQTAVNLLHALASDPTQNATAQAAHDTAISQATALQTAIQNAWAQFAAAGTPTVADFVKAPVTALTETGQAAYATAGRAVTAVEKAAAPALASTGMLLQYGPWILGGLAVLYLSSFLPRAGRD